MQFSAFLGPLKSIADAGVNPQMSPVFESLTTPPNFTWPCAHPGSVDNASFTFSVPKKGWAVVLSDEADADAIGWSRPWPIVTASTPFTTTLPPPATTKS
mmetsp:Transcript_25219/g.34909  ORF Transcript_25219/g.34909 Transcript_25219/m.34909 type:complete len:100 (+) Transcript_25219:380-679(+)